MFVMTLLLLSCRAYCFYGNFVDAYLFTQEQVNQKRSSFEIIEILENYILLYSYTHIRLKK